MAFEELLRDWDGEFLASRFDAPTQTWMLVGVHSTRLGPGFGGTRMKPYAAVADAVRDVLRLSQAMTLKNAMAGIPFGGGKAVLAVPAVPQGEERRRLMDRYADLIGSLGGSYVTACDMNTNEQDMDMLASRCPNVMGMSEERGGSGSSAPDTALGVYHGIRAALGHVYGSDDPSGRTVVIQGAGAVGAPLAELLASDDASLVVADVDPERAAAVSDRIGAQMVDAGTECEVACDVFSPCATGGVLNEATIDRLRCRIVAGAANNQLSSPDDAERLAAAGILYAPDYVVNAGGVIHLAGYERLGWSREQVQDRLMGIGETLRGIFATAETQAITPAAAADHIASERIAAA
ncbi:MAG: Glu/Leu/Phe/Val dehydrogenase dimerization domain-containing protein [Actinomycetota bacterium]